jgi:hypothetical protein
MEGFGGTPKPAAFSGGPALAGWENDLKDIDALSRLRPRKIQATHKRAATYRMAMLATIQIATSMANVPQERCNYTGNQ